jgi:hypothetical protein
MASSEQSDSDEWTLDDEELRGLEGKRVTARSRGLDPQEGIVSIVSRGGFALSTGRATYWYGKRNVQVSSS